MMQKRTLYSLLIISFIVVFAASMAMADTIKVQSKANLARCADQQVNVTADITSAGVSAIELVLEVSQTSGDCATPLTNLGFEWGLDTDVLTSRYVEIQSDGVAPDTIRAAAMYVDNGSGLGAGNGQLIGTITFHTGDCCAAVASIDNIVFDYPNETCDITTGVVDANGQNTAITFVPGVVSISNQAPTVDPIADMSLAWNTGSINFTATATDADMANGCESLSFSKASGPAGLTVAGNGLVTWDPTGDQVCDNEVVVMVTDACGAEAVDTFNVCVTNQAPVITQCAPDGRIGWGDTYTGTVVANDPDGGPHPKIFSIASFDDLTGPLDPGVNPPTVDPNTGEVTWVTEYDSSYTGTFQVCVSVTDSAAVCDPCSPLNADTCCFTIQVIPFEISIAKLHGSAANHYAGVVQGQEVTVPVTMLNSGYVNYPIGGFDFLIAYDQSALSFLYADPGQFIDDCDWEYFTYRQGYDGNCGNGCPSGLVRIVALAEQNNGNHHPSCFTNGPGVSNELTVLHFLVTNDRTFECQFVPIKFFWVDCGDNGISSQGGDTLFIGQRVFDYTGAGFDENTGTDSYLSWTEVTDLSQALPSYTGPTAPTCDVSAKFHPVRLVDFRNGGVDIICSGDIDATGDINVNGIGYEVADAVMFTNYFISGLSAFSDHVDASIAASDANKDGVPLTVGDLVYLIRVVVGDAVPYPKLDVVNATYSFENNVMSIDQGMAVAHLVFQGNVNVELLAPNMRMETGMVDGNTNVVVYPDFKNGNTMVETFQGKFLRADGHLLGNPEFATYDGNPVAAKNVPTTFHVDQNYPNPFNPSTVISFAMPAAGHWVVDIYNVTGQRVQSFNGSDDAGVVNVTWDASNLASGVYFYRVTAGTNSKTMKAILLK